MRICIFISGLKGLTLHCPKLVKYIKIRTSCDERVPSRKILRSSIFCFRHLEFEPSGSAVTPNLKICKNPTGAVAGAP